uniref:bifunctional peptidase and arginyl-hydroxylase JMJD5-like n=1 Tax=Styela clava TaxID=7725 RepID=UPI00193A270B|nr:bifunctional peptidase and arginyl-hydroxylase JMJD5-like [Styela clava]
MFCVSKLAFLIFYTTLWHVEPAESDDPPGHLQPFGNHMPPFEIDVIDTPPTAQEFLDKYIKVNKPVVIKGAAKVFDIFKTWKDDEYLRIKYGKWISPIELAKIESGPEGLIARMPFSWFLSNYEKKDLAILRDIASTNPMRDEISVLKSMSCGGFKDLLTDVIFIFSSGSGESAIHWDPAENMHCLLDGTKDWAIIHRKDRHILPKSKESSMYTSVNQSSIDMYKYPVMQDIPWYHAFIEAGDCIFVPNSSPHYVRSGDSRNMAISVWFVVPGSLNLTDCPEDEADLPDSAPVGRGHVSRLDHIKSMVYMLINDRSGNISLPTFIENGVGLYQLEEFGYMIFEAIDENEDEVITSEEIEALTDVSEEFWNVFSDNKKEYFVIEENGNIKDMIKKEEL